MHPLENQPANQIGAVAEVTFAESDSSHVPKFLNPDPSPSPQILQIWESNPCSDSGSYWCNRNFPIFLLK